MWVRATKYKCIHRHMNFTYRFLMTCSNACYFFGFGEFLVFFFFFLHCGKINKNKIILSFNKCSKFNVYPTSSFMELSLFFFHLLFFLGETQYIAGGCTELWNWLSHNRPSHDIAHLALQFDFILWNLGSWQHVDIACIICVSNKLSQSIKTFCGLMDLIYGQNGKNNLAAATYMLLNCCTAPP